MTDLQLAPFADAHQTAERVAQLAAAIRSGSGHRITAEFNGTPMNGYPGDTTKTVLLRWHYERILYQLRTGVLRIEDVQPED